MYCNREMGHGKSHFKWTVIIISRDYVKHSHLKESSLGESYVKSIDFKILVTISDF